MARRRRRLRVCWSKANLPESGQSVVYDGRTGEPFKSPVTVGLYVYVEATSPG